MNRRQLLGLGAAGLVMPRRLFAGPDLPTDRKFLFIYCYGGWDTTMLFTPMFDVGAVDTEDDATTAEINGITFVDHEERPSVRQFFEDYGSRACVINGMEVRSVTHERCQRLMFTGSSESTADGWAVSIASNGAGDYAVPHLVLSGPAFTAENAANVVRAGEVGQLTELLDGSALSSSTLPVVGPSAAGELREDAFVSARLDAFNQTAAAGRAVRGGTLYSQALDNLALLRSMSDSVDLNPTQTGCRRDIAADAGCAFNAFESGLSRCALTRDDGWCSITWDTHTGNHYQAVHYEELFGYLNTMMADLDTRVGSDGQALRDQVTIVVFSEMGRHPVLTNGGRGHWTFTSAMLLGAGVRGGQVIGEMNENFEGQPVDLASGGVSGDGTSLLPGNLGATLVEIAGLDPAEYVPSSDPIAAAIAE